MPEVPLTFTDYREMKAKIHSQILQEIDLESLNKLQENVARNRVSEAIRELLHRDRTPLALTERERMVNEIVDELFGLGPIEPLLADAAVSDILVNGPDRIYVERRGMLERTDLFFNDSAHLMRIIDRIVSRVGRRVDESSPMVDARLADGSRVNAIIPPLALDGPSVSIRRFGGHKLSVQAYIEGGTLTKPMIDLLEACVKGKLNVMVSGGTGAGKTTLLNILSSFIPETERIITIEDAAELRLKQPHVVRLETRPPNIEGKGGVRQRQLVINALRMRPDRIIVGEVRGEEAIDMLQAMNTGHEGSLTTIHANTPRDALSRLETMIAMAELNLPDRAVRQQIASAINLIVQVSRLPDGSRKITNICEISGMEGNVITTQDLFVYERMGYDEKNRIRGAFRPLGIRPKFTEKLESHGIRFDPDMFFRDTNAVKGGR
jgi:pilus assembly protein CpaF